MLAFGESPAEIAVVALLALVLITGIAAIIRHRYFSEPRGFREMAREVIALFGPCRPSLQRERRFRQRESMNGIQMERMGALNTDWYAAGSYLRLLFHTYSAANAAAFR